MLFRMLFGIGRIVTYTVHESPTPLADRIDRAEQLRFIKDGFTPAAAVFAPLWLAGHRLWTWVALYVAILVALGLANAMFGLSDSMTAAAVVGLHILIGFEADDIERAALERKGWTTLASVSGQNATECERRFLDTWLPLQPSLAPRPLPTAVPPAGATASPTRSGAAGAADRLAALWRPTR